MEVTVAAFASQHGARAQTGIVLAAFAIGSGLAGLAYGTRQWIAPLSLRFLVSSVVFMLLLPIMLLAGNVLTVAVLSAWSGSASRRPSSPASVWWTSWFRRGYSPRA